MSQAALVWMATLALVFTRGIDAPSLSRVSGEEVWPAMEPGSLAPRVVPMPTTSGEPPIRRPFSHLAAGKMLSDLSVLTSIGSDRLYRTSGTGGEREAFDWLAGQLGDLRFLESLGASVERQRFRIPLASEVRQAGVSVRVGGVDVAVAGHALQGHRDELSRTLRFDSDGIPNDSEPNPVAAEGNVTVVLQMGDLNALPPGSLRGRILIASYELVDQGVVTASVASQAAAALLRTEPAALVLVTRYSNVRGQGHGSFAGDVSALATLQDPAAVPTVYVKLEDLFPAGIGNLSELGRIARARVTWDADVISPADSQLLVFRIPGIDSSRALLVGAHLDSPNSPGALDDGSGSVALLAAARALDESFVRPPVDTLLLWFGSHERGLYGSSVFAASHSELLDRSIAMIQLDCLTHPLDGMTGGLTIESASYGAFGDFRNPLLEAMPGLASPLGVWLRPLAYGGITSDNSSFDGLDVPSGDTIYLSDAMREVHIDGHLHDPYDDLPLVSLHGRELVDMARVALGAVLDLPRRTARMRVTPPRTSRAVFVASHTEHPHMTPAQMAVFGKALAWEGWDVDIVPYGTPVRDEDLAGAGLVVALPVVDYPTAFGETDPYDESWTPEEIDVLRRYTEAGGFLLLTNSGNLLRYGLTPFEENEDWPDGNALAAEFGIAFEDRRLHGNATPTTAHPLLYGVSTLGLAEGNGLAVSAGAGEVLARAGGDDALVLVPFGSQGGEVLALGDLALLGNKTSRDTPNLVFLSNLARYAREPRSISSEAPGRGPRSGRRGARDRSRAGPAPAVCASRAPRWWHGAR